LQERLPGKLENFHILVQRDPVSFQQVMFFNAALEFFSGPFEERVDSLAC